MIAFIERTNSLTKSPVINENIFQYEKLTLKNSIGSPSPKKIPGDSFKPISTLKNYNLSNPSSKNSSRRSSPARAAMRSPRGLDFQQIASKTLKELDLIRTSKLSKQAEFITKEKKIIRKIKELISNEFKNRKPIKNTSRNDSYYQQIQKIIKQSAEDLIVIEKECSEIDRENNELKASFENASNSSPISYKKRHKNVKNIDECILDIYRLSQGKNEGFPQEPKKIKNYLMSIDKIANEILEKIKSDNFEEIASSLACYIQDEKTNLESAIIENQKMIDYERRVRKDLEEKLKNRWADY